MGLESLIILLLIIALIGVIVWAITTYIPMPQPFKVIIYVVAAIVVILWLIGNLGGNVRLFH